jgi:2'-5' RNA ligase
MTKPWEATGGRGSTVRVFLAFTPPPAVRTGLMRWQAAARRAGVPGRYPKEAEWHLTLLFLGERSPQDLSDIGDTVSRHWPEYRPATCRFSRWLVLPHQRAPRVLAVTTPESSGTLDTLYRALNRDLGEDARPFRPHITLVRVNGPVPDLPLSAPVSWVPDRLTLYRSVLTPAGPQYRPLRTWLTTSSP